MEAFQEQQNNQLNRKVSLSRVEIEVITNCGDQIIDAQDTNLNTQEDHR
jgi:hypothetical protein